LTKITQTHTTMGTMAYISPEQARGEEVDQRSDVWSLGVVLYEMLTGQLPFPGARSEAIIHAILTAKPKPLKQLRGDAPAETEQIVHHALEKDLRSRYASASEVLKDLTEYQSSLALSKTELGRWRLISGWIKQKRVATPGLLILLVLGSLLGWLFHRQANVRWAQEEALPKIKRLIDEEKFVPAFALGRQAEKYIPTNATLNKLLSSMSMVLSIHTTPGQAKIYFKEYSDATGPWTYLGQSPLENVRVPWGGFRFKVEKDGFATLETIEDPGFAVVLKKNVLTFSLVPQGNNLPGMVRISAWKSPFVPNFPGFEALEPVELPEYWIGRYEVTNKEFKRFVDSGGYENHQFWKQAFLNDGREMPWGDALSKFHDLTGRPGPSTWELGSFPKGQEDYPVTGVSWYEAAAFAEFAGMSLPTLYHWDNAALTLMSSYIIPLSNFSGKGPARVGSYQGMSCSGTYDMAGNVKEWCWNAVGDGKRYILGGAWDEPGYMFNEPDARSPFDRASDFGFRCAKYSFSKAVTDPVTVPGRDYKKEEPVSDQVFDAYRSMFSYDKKELSPITESVDDTDENWKQENITFTPAYGTERGLIQLFLPKKFSPPYQIVIYIPWEEHLGQFQMRLVDFIVKSGRALLCPIFRHFPQTDYPDTSSSYRDYVINLSKELSRSLDYAGTRADLDHDKIAYYGFSWGASMGAILPAIEKRIKANVLHAGAFSLQRARPEAEQINFAPRVTSPVLMLNGRYDFFNPVETSQEPMFRLLGTPQRDKRFVVFECGHVIPRNEVIKETLDWLDRYLGPVKRKEQ
jgi:formylglycine-generating enzyme required for sulfatase activity/predicted esterase